MLEQLIELLEYVAATLRWMVLLPLIVIEIILIVSFVYVAIKMIKDKFKHR